ncbi:hypothetical protein JCM18920_2355 [Cutibacterium acnes JCM 18920]|nr:hypothetical protein JCM18920_2355 [Cutibacterium acnes JCM 18920]
MRFLSQVDGELSSPDEVLPASAGKSLTDGRGADSEGPCGLVAAHRQIVELGDIAGGGAQPSGEIDDDLATWENRRIPSVPLAKTWIAA